jgi:putative SOS response-associated peptidase YedK
MCGRLALFATGDELAERFQLVEAPLLGDCYIIAPTQAIGAVRSKDASCKFAQVCTGFFHLGRQARPPTIGSSTLGGNGFQ